MIKSSFSLLTLMMAIWAITLSLLYHIQHPDFITFIGRINFGAGLQVFMFLFLFAYYFPEESIKFKRPVNTIIVIVTSVITALTIFTPLIDTRDYIEDGHLVTEFGPLYFLYAINLVGLGIVVVTLLYKKMKTHTGLKKKQMIFFLSGFALSAVLILITNILLPAIGIFSLQEISPLLSLFFVGFTAYAIVKYRLMDIRFVITRSVIYAVLVLFVTGSFVLMTFLGSEYFATESQADEIAVLIIEALIIVLLLEPLKNLLARATNKIFFKAAIDYDTVTKRITNVINEELELDKLITRFTEEVEKDLRLKDANMLLPVGEGVFIVPEEMMSQESLEKKKGRKKKTNAISNTPLLRYLHDNRSEVVIIDEIDRKVADAETDSARKRFDKMRNSMEDMNAYAALPIPSITTHDLEAILILSRKKSGEPFSGQDIQLLQVIAPQLASGIQKARLFQEAKQFNVKLQREVDKATKDLRAANAKLTELDRAKSEFMSIASHQLRTPLAGIIGYLSMIEAGDFGKVNKEQVPIIHDVTQATQRLIRMVNIFLNVTRIEAGRFVMNYTKQPFADVIEAIYKELKPTAEKKGVELVYKKKKLPEVEVDADKIKDVILNLVDNAIKYSPDGRVEITAEANTRSVHVKVKDSGVGIAPLEAKNLFSKFVRGSGIARVEPNGSGLGLFIAKKITEGHGGKIWAESEGEGKGSTFQFKIPLKADKESKKKAEEFKKRAKKE